MPRLKWRTKIVDVIAVAIANPFIPKANRHKGIPIFPVFGRINGGNNLTISLFNNFNTIRPIIEKIPTYIKVSTENFKKISKTDQSGEGMIKAIPYFNNNNYCPVISLKEWIDVLEIKSGKIFDISDKSVALIIKKYTSLSGLNPNRYSGHSLRSGFATSTAESGAEERNIMVMTGHKTTQMVRRYIQEANLFKNNALNKIKI